MDKVERIKPIFLGFIIFWWVLFPFDYNYFDCLTNAFQFLPVKGLKTIDPNLQFETDTYGTYLLVVFSLLLGAIFSPLIEKFLHWRKIDVNRALQLTLELLLFYFLFSYGWNKVVKQQFYAPEPNTLYTPLGHLSKDIAYWSVIGSSYSYTVALGITEMLCAVLLLFNRTKFLASLLAIFTFSQVVLINFSFDISVKLLSFSLLSFSIAYSLLFFDKWKVILGFSNFSREQNNQKPKLIFWIVVLLLGLDSVLPNVFAGTFNGDTRAKIKHFGAYEIANSKEYKRVFVHSQGYLILQHHNDQMQDFKLRINENGIIETPGYSLKCIWNEGVGRIIIQKDTFSLKRIETKDLPLMKEEFHFSADTYH